MFHNQRRFLSPWEAREPQLESSPCLLQLEEGPACINKDPEICWRRDRLSTPVFMVFPCGPAGKETACNAGDLGSIPGLGRSPGEEKGYPFQYSGLENSMDCIIHGVTNSWTQLSLFHFSELPKINKIIFKKIFKYHDEARDKAEESEKFSISNSIFPTFSFRTGLYEARRACWKFYQKDRKHAFYASLSLSLPLKNECSLK